MDTKDLRAKSKEELVKTAHELKKKLINDFGKGVTIYNGRGGYSEDSKTDIDILFTFVTRLEANKIKQELILIDPEAVIIEQGIKDVRGGIIKKRPLY